MTPSAPNSKLSWLDTLLLSSAGAAILFACSILTWMAWQAPGMINALQRQPTLQSEIQAIAIDVPQNASTALQTSRDEITFTPVPTAAAPPTATQTPTASPTPSPTPTPTLVSPTLPPAKAIVIDLSDQTLTAIEDAVPVFSALVSTGRSRTPTPVGEFAIYSKVRSQTMSGPGYRLPNVQYVAYFYSAYAIHGTYWHDNFGHPMSHGCVNMRDIDAQWLYTWAPIGTPVTVRQ